MSVNDEENCKFSINNITFNDIITFKIEVPAKQRVQDYIKQMQSDSSLDTVERISMPKVLAECHMQLMWLIKNKDQSQKVKLFATNKKTG